MDDPASCHCKYQGTMTLVKLSGNGHDCTHYRNRKIIIILHQIVIFCSFKF